MWGRIKSGGQRRTDGTIRGAVTGDVLMCRVQGQPGLMQGQLNSQQNVGVILIERLKCLPDKKGIKV